MSSSCPNTIIVKEGALKEIATLLKDYKKVICVSDNEIYAKYSGKIEDLLQKAPTWLMVSQITDEGQTPNLSGDIVLGVGGGKSLDAAKILASATGLEWISVPTAASHDGIASEVASVSHNGYKYSRKCKLPVAVVADLTIIAEAPKQLYLAGMGDIICKASSLSEWCYAHEKHGESIDRRAYSIVRSALDRVLQSGDLATLVHAEIDAGRAMCMAGSSRPCSGTEHAISHAMERNYSGLHGLQVAFATPLCIHFLELENYAIYKAKYINSVIRERGLPHKLNDMNMSISAFLEHIDHALKIMKKRGRYSILTGVSRQRLETAIQSLY